MPAAHETGDAGRRAPTRDFVDDDSQSVGFLDVPGLGPDRLMDAIVDGFSRLFDDAVLTAYCTGIEADAMTDLCEQRGVEVVHAVAHATGTTFILRRSTR